MKFIASTLIMATGLAPAFGAPTSTESASAAPSLPVTNSSSPDVMFQLSSDPGFAFVLAGQMSFANGGGANSGEILRAASQIKPGDTESFHDEFKFLADQSMALAQKSDPAKNPVSVRDALFRAATYYRAADWYIRDNQSDPRIHSLWDSQLAAFDQAISLLEVPGVRYNVSTSHGFNVNIVVYKASNCSDPKPTLLIGNGFDASQEGLYHAYCRSVLQLGWNCVTYEGPGQPTVRRQQDIGFIPEWWNVVSPVVDHLFRRPDVDSEKIGLVGNSYGSLLGLIAATQEPRLKFVIGTDGQFNYGKMMLHSFPDEIVELFNSGNKTAFDHVLNQVRLDPTESINTRWFISEGLFAWNTDSPFDWMTRFVNITLEGLEDQVKVPVFVGKGEDDSVTGNQAELLNQALGDNAVFYEFKTEVGAGEHSQIGAEGQLDQAVLDWAIEQFGM